jgi:4-amino-4-deoxy-L-arabinose transferase-like glycosyltransferase
MSLGVVSRFVGERMPSPVDAGRPWRATLRGGVTCALAFVTPVVGWFVLLPAAVATGLGAMTLAALASKPAPTATPAEAAV